MNLDSSLTSQYEWEDLNSSDTVINRANVRIFSDVLCC